MAQNFNSPWVGALAANLTAADGQGADAQLSAQPRWDLAGPPDDRSWPLVSGAGWDDADDRLDETPDADSPADAASGAAARDVSVYQIGFRLLIGVGVAVGLSTAMLLR